MATFTVRDKETGNIFTIRERDQGSIIQTPSSLERLGQKAGAVGKGALKSFGNLALGAGDLTQKLMGTIPGLQGSAVGNALNLDVPVRGDPEIESLVTPKGGFEKAGFLGGEIAQFAIPASKIAKTGKATSALGKAGELAARTLKEGATAGGVRALQTGGKPTDTLIAASVGGAVPLVGAGFKSLGAFTRKTGEKIQFNVVRPVQADIADGFKIGLIRKYKVGGPLSKSAAKVESELNKRAVKLNSLIDQADEPIDLTRALQKAEEKLFTGKGKVENLAQQQFGPLRSKFDNYVDQVLGAFDDGLLTPRDAQIFKQSVGQQGAWLSGVKDIELQSSERMFNAIYRGIREEIERVAPKGLKEINKELGELLTLKHAIIRRIPVAERNSAFPLTQLIPITAAAAARNPLPLAVAGVKGASASGRVGDVLTRAGSNLETRTPGAFLQSLIGLGKRGGTQVPNNASSPSPNR